MWKTFMGAALAAVSLAGCMSEQQPKVQYVWVRSDGQLLRENPVLNRQYELDRTACFGEMERADLSAPNFCRGAVNCAIEEVNRQPKLESVAKGCMASKGYAFMPLDGATEWAAAARAQSKAGGKTASR